MIHGSWLKMLVKRKLFEVLLQTVWRRIPVIHILAVGLGQALYYNRNTASPLRAAGNREDGFFRPRRIRLWRTSTFFLLGIDTVFKMALGKAFFLFLNYL